MQWGSQPGIICAIYVQVQVRIQSTSTKFEDKLCTGGVHSSLAVSCVRHEGNVSGTLDSDRENALMTRAVAADATWQNLAALCHELLQTVWIFVVYEIHFIGAKAACLTATWW